MNKIIFTFFFSLILSNCISQKKAVVTDSCYVSSHKFILSETKDGIVEIKAFLSKQQVPVLKTVKMSGPVYFVRENGKENILQDDVFVENGDIVKVFLIVGNEAPECVRKDRNLNFEDDFCGMNVQGIIISPDGIVLTDLVYSGFTCIKENALGLKDLFTFANSEIKKSK